RMTARIEQTERLALASAEVTEELGSDHLEKEFKRLEIGDNAEARLIELKRKMGLLPPVPEESQSELPAAESRKRLSDGSDSPVHDAELIEEFEELERGEQSGN